MASLKEYLWSGKWLYKSCSLLSQILSSSIRVKATHFIDEITQPAMRLAEAAVKQLPALLWQTALRQTAPQKAEQTDSLFFPDYLVNNISTTANQLWDGYCVISTDSDLFSHNSFTTKASNRWCLLQNLQQIIPHGPKGHTIFLKTTHCKNKVSICINDLGQWHKLHVEEQTNTTCPVCSVLWQRFNPYSSTDLKGFCSTVTLSLYGYLSEISPYHCLTATL